jgi:glycosyltransferase involved in cell wall biosynthesis
MELSFPLIGALQSRVKKGGRIILHLHGIFNLNTYVLASLFGGKIPTAAQSHDPTYLINQRFSRIWNPLRKYALHKIDRFFVSSETETREFSNVCDVRKIHVAPIPVDMKLFHKIDKKIARAKLGWRSGDHYVLYVGRLEERKGLSYIFQASRILLPRFRNLHLVAVGSGYSATKSTNGITFVGRVSYNELPNYYNAADVCILPSLRESWGRVILESLACQTPVVATWTGCVPTLMKEGVGGLFTVPMRDGIALANQISEILPDSESVRSRIERKKLVKYGSDYFVRTLLTDYRELADRYY